MQRHVLDDARIASSALGHALRPPPPETARSGVSPCFLGRKPPPRLLLCEWPGRGKAQRLRFPTLKTHLFGDGTCRINVWESHSLSKNPIVCSIPARDLP